MYCFECSRHLFPSHPLIRSNDWRTNKKIWYVAIGLQVSGVRTRISVIGHWFWWTQTWCWHGNLEDHLITNHLLRSFLFTSYQYRLLVWSFWLLTDLQVPRGFSTANARWVRVVSSEIGLVKLRTKIRNAQKVTAERSPRALLYLTSSYNHRIFYRDSNYRKLSLLDFLVTRSANFIFCAFEKQNFGGKKLLVKSKSLGISDQISTTSGAD